MNPAPVQFREDPASWLCRRRHAGGKVACSLTMWFSTRCGPSRAGTGMPLAAAPTARPQPARARSGGGSAEHISRQASPPRRPAASLDVDGQCLRIIDGILRAMLWMRGCIMAAHRTSRCRTGRVAHPLGRPRGARATSPRGRKCGECHSWFCPSALPRSPPASSSRMHLFRQCPAGLTTRPGGQPSSTFNELSRRIRTHLPPDSLRAVSGDRALAAA